MSVYRFRCVLIFFFCMLFSEMSLGQYHPGQGAHLNYTSVCFSFPWVENAADYELTLTRKPGNVPTVYRFKANKYIVDGLLFGAAYTWKITARDAKEQVIYLSEERHFSVDHSEKTGREYVRFKEIANGDCGNELLILDYAQLAINRDQKITWYLPKLPFMSKNPGIRDLKLSDDGTFLAIIDSVAYELDLDGTVLWKAPNDGKVSGQGREDYHHDFQKLPSGNYMVLGNERVKRLFPGEKDTTTYESGTIIEYNPKGQVVWEWHAKDFFTEKMLTMRRREDGAPDPATHMNALNIAGNSIYAGFRDASWILKINKTTRQVEEIYGGPPSGLPNHYAIGLFRYQHDANVLRNGSIAVINNDSIKDPKKFSSLVVFSQGEGGFSKGELRFRFPFNYDTLSSGKSLKLGNVNELANGNYLVNMGAINRVFEVTPGGKVVWDVFVEKLDTFKRVWRFFPQYRVATTSSLYPNEFTCKWRTKTVKSDQLTGQLTLFNVGSEANSYIIYVQTASGALTELKKITATQSLDAKTVSLAIPQKYRQQDGTIQLVIQVAGKSKRALVRVK